MEMVWFLFWLPMIALAFLNASFRELVLTKRFSERQAHRVSTVILMILCGFYAVVIFRCLQIQSTGQALSAGMTWTVLTVIFEFSLGKLRRRSWKELFEQYNLFAGHIWPIFLLFLFLLPYLLYVFG